MLGSFLLPGDVLLMSTYVGVPPVLVLGVSVDRKPAGRSPEERGRR